MATAGKPTKMNRRGFLKRVGALLGAAALSPAAAQTQDAGAVIELSGLEIPGTVKTFTHWTSVGAHGSIASPGIVTWGHLHTLDAGEPIGDLLDIVRPSESDMALYFGLPQGRTGAPLDDDAPDTAALTEWEQTAGVWRYA